MKNENEIARDFHSAVVARDGMTYKVNPVVGFPDRIVLLPGCEVCFVELKAANGKLSKAQLFRIEDMRKKGAVVYVYSPNDTSISDFVEMLANRRKRGENGK